MSKSPDTNTQWLLADRALTPIVSSIPLPTTDNNELLRREDVQLQSLTSITSTAINAFDSAAKLGLGLPQRIVVETQSGGPALLHAYLNPSPPNRHTKGGEQAVAGMGIVEEARDDLRPLTPTTDGASERRQERGESSPNGLTGSTESAGADDEEETDSENSSQQSPFLIASIVASSLREAKKVVGGLERTGREIQKALILERQHEDPQKGVEDNRDG